MVGGLIAALSSSKLLEFLFRRKTDQRKETASAVSQELANLTVALEAMRKVYSQEMDKSNERQALIDKLYKENKSKDRTVLKLTTRNAKKDLEIERLRFMKCEIRKCPGRQPPNKEY
ncbi:MAG: hypothetical protein LIO93_03140 [Bacteroidales bacterium]|nr:hypothetical protein [Bacteroidales bacterium]